MLDTMIPSCFSHPNSPSSTSQSQSQVPNQNLITCIYQTQLCNSPTYLTLTWSKSLFSHSLTIYAADSFSITISLQPSTFSLFGTRPGSKSIYLTHHHYQKIKLYWDFTRAEFATNSAEPESCFYVAITCNAKLEFFLGDLLDELTQRSGLVPTRHVAMLPALLSRREHVFGRRNYVSRAVFLGSKHEIGIECGGGTLKVKVDGEISLIVRRLAWKFRGNEKIYVGGVEVEFFWDVFNWVSNVNNGINGNGHGVFVFQVGDGGVWPEMVGPEKRLLRKSLSSPAGNSASMAVSSSNSPSCSSVLQWAEESSDGGRSSCSSSTRSYSGSNGGFSLLLYAWRKD
ncbi:Sulfate/thiosulfate import ATP-binding protein cysA [Trema orientale]|uniref:Sulfate/thiosulfate import ATP-binding protein cysA n=1 Tax=Trema orientale TaxID=63057 RepID=A0A2P5ENI0_TREOI|nr:Sulfate/thiosulfate import ATP-binding protein cysA [Trema orientale]